MLGGRSSSELARTVVRADLPVDKGIVRSPVPDPRSGGALVVVDDVFQYRAVSWAAIEDRIAPRSAELDPGPVAEYIPEGTAVEVSVAGG